MQHQDNGKNLNSKETIVILQECPKILGSPETCGIQWVNQQHKCQKFTSEAENDNSFSFLRIKITRQD